MTQYKSEQAGQEGQQQRQGQQNNPQRQGQQNNPQRQENKPGGGSYGQYKCECGKSFATEDELREHEPNCSSFRPGSQEPRQKTGGQGEEEEEAA